jgi:DNA-binding CsgD family transcriptional regulator/PAS domain-containing protein
VSIHERLLGVIETIYDAALDEALWPDALRQLTDITDSQAASFWVLDGSAQPRLPIFVSINFDPAFIAEYLDRMVPHDPTVQYLLNNPDEVIVHDGLFITEREKDRHAYYDWHARYSDTRFRLVSRMSPVPSIQAGIALHRTRQPGRYESVEIEQLAMLHRHIERALSIGFRIGTLGTMHQCTTDLLDANPAAIILLDVNRRIIYSNRAAELLGDTGDGIRLSAAGITLSRKQDHDKLHCLIEQATRNAARSVASGAMQAPRPSGHRPYLIRVTPVSHRCSGLSVLRPAVCVVITDPDGKNPLHADNLKAAFGLTDAEARLAVLLAAGDNLRGAAQKLAISYGTARSRLAEVFRKTDTHRQGQLIKLLLHAVKLG